MKILHLIYDDQDNPWVGGGGAIRTHKINEALAENHDITVITGTFPGCERICNVNKVKYLRIGSPNSYLLSRLTYAFQVRGILKHTPADLLVEEISGNSPTFAPRFFRGPAIGVLQNYFGPDIIKKNLFTGPLSCWYEGVAIRRLFENLITVNPELENLAKVKNPLAKINTIPQGVDGAFFREGGSEEYLLFVGRLDYYQKGLDILLKSFARLPDNSIKLKLVGPGNPAKLYAMADKLNIRDRILHHGSVPHEKMAEIYNCAYFLCLPSRYEGWPLVCLESYSCRKPVVGTDIPGLRNVVQHGTTGLLSEKDNVERFAENISALLGDSKLRRRLGTKAAEFARQFLWENQAEQQLRFYQTVIEKHSSR